MQIDCIHSAKQGQLTKNSYTNFVGFSLKVAMNQGSDANPSRGFFGCGTFRRFLTCVMCFILTSTAWSVSTLSMAMVCMVNSTAVAMAHDVVNGTSWINHGFSRDVANETTIMDHDYEGSIIWTPAQQGLLFSSSFWGSAVIAIAIPWAISHFGPKRVVLCCLIINLICSLALPTVAVKGGLWPTFIVRFIMGFGGLVAVDTALTVIITHWIPAVERGLVLTIYTMGSQIPSIIASPVNAAFCRNKYLFGGWPFIFYFSGVITIVAIFTWQVFMNDLPSQSGWVSLEEKKYIEESLQSQGLEKHANGKTPWRQLFSSNVLWCCIVNMFADGLIVMTLRFYVPTYFQQVLHFDLKSDGLLSALPFIAQTFSKMALALLERSLKKHTKIDHSVLCKIFNTIGTLGTSFFLVACAFMSCRHAAWTIVLLCMATACFGPIVLGVYTSLVCFAPAYTGIVNGMARFAVQVASIIAPAIVGAITAQVIIIGWSDQMQPMVDWAVGSGYMQRILQEKAEEWRLVFFIMAAVMTGAGIYFLFAATVEIQSWAMVEKHDKKDMAPVVLPLSVFAVSEDKSQI